MIKRSHSQSKGFTLIELLVVIAIIAILAAILFPVFAKAREKARQTACLSNVKQINMGIMMYLQDYDEVLPIFWFGWHTDGSPSTWKDVVAPYIKSAQLYKCPSDPNFDSVVNSAPWVANSYAINPALQIFNPDGSWKSDWGNYYDQPCSIGAMEAPAETLLFADKYGYSEKLSWECVINPTTSTPAGAVWCRHSEGANVGFADGHSKWMKSDAIIGPNGSLYLWRADK